MLILIVVVVAVLAFLLIGSSITSNVATATQAAATLETARALNSAQSANSFLTVAVIVLAIGFAIAAVLVAILYVRFKANESSTKKWVSGPGAKWGKIGDGPAQRLEPGDLNSLITLMVLKQMDEFERKERPALPERTPDNEIDSGWKWG